MKKTILLLCLSTAMIAAQGQTLIPRAGITLSKIAGDDLANVKNKLGFTLGAAFNIPIKNNFSFQPELLFTQKGFKQELDTEFDGFDVSVDVDLTINYLEIPLLLKVGFDEGPVNIFINAGPAIGIGLGGNFNTKVSFEGFGSESASGKVRFGEDTDEEDDQIYFDNRLELGMQAGLGVMISNKVIIDFRYNHGFTSLMDDEDMEARHRQLIFTVGIPIKLK